ALAPVWVSRTGRTYQPGLGPHAENAAVRLVLEQLRGNSRYISLPMGQSLPYPGASRQSCDVWVAEPPDWAIEVKMARFYGDNGKPDDTAIKDLLSPYESDRSALSDCLKLARSGFSCRKGLLVYGFEMAERPLEPVIGALETLARQRVDLGPR